MLEQAMRSNSETEPYRTQSESRMPPITTSFIGMRSTWRSASGFGNAIPSWRCTVFRLADAAWVVTPGLRRPTTLNHVEFRS